MKEIKKDDIVGEMDDDIVDVEVDELFCGLETPHWIHFAVDLLEDSQLFVCPGYYEEIVRISGRS